MPLLYYWRPDNYRRDRGAGLDFTLIQNSELMAQAQAGDTLWAFSRNAAGEYVLAAEFSVLHAENIEPIDYGRYQITADPSRSRYFDVDRSPSAEAVIRSLSVHPRAKALGMSFQGTSAVRQLHDADEAELRRFARGLPVLTMR